MSPELVMLLIVVAAGLWVRHEWHVRRYPQRLKCRTCGGSGSISSKDMFGRKVKGPCPECKGKAWVNRR